MSQANSGKSILILGGSDMQVPAIQIGRELGWRVVVADINPRAPGIKFADDFERVDLKDLAGMTDAAKRQQASSGLDGVFTAGTDFSATVAWVAGQLGLPGIPYETALDASDKSRMRGVFAASGLASPAFVRLTADDLAGSGINGLEAISRPLVIKPVDSMGSRGVRRVDSDDDVGGAVRDAISHSRTGAAIVEEYIDGPEFSLDAVIYHGEIHLCGIADRHIFFPPYFVEMGHTMPSIFPEDQQQAVIDLFFAGIRALGISDGAAKGDIKLSAGGPVIGEIAARLSGGYMSGWTYPYSSGVKVTEAAMRIAVGLPPGDLSPTREFTAAERAFISIPGTVDIISGGEAVLELTEESFFRVEPGDPVQFPTNNVQKCGNVICVEPERRTAVGRAEQARRQVLIRLKPFDGATSRFLFGAEEPWIPDGFQVAEQVKTDGLSGMPPFYGKPGNRPIGVLEAPFLLSYEVYDWHGESISRAFSRVLAESGLKAVTAPANEDNRLILAALFWRAFLRGGIQGGLWVIDSVGAVKSVDDPLWREVLKWCE